MKELIYLQFAFNTFFLVALWFLARERGTRRRRKSERAENAKRRPSKANIANAMVARYADTESQPSGAVKPDLSSLVGRVEREELAAEAAFRRRLQDRWNQRAI